LVRQDLQDQLNTKEGLAELEDFIAKNRLVSKEAQMSLMSGEGIQTLDFLN
jgi:hypothetical protein